MNIRNSDKSNFDMDHKQIELSQKNIFAIYVSYYVKIKVSLNSIGGEISLKIPFILCEHFKENNQKTFFLENPSTNLITKNNNEMPENINFLNDKFNQLSLDNLSMDSGQKNLQNISVQAQVHHQKYLESDV